MHRVHKIKLDPTQEQAIYFARACGVARFAFNWALAAWKEEYEAGDKPNEAALRKRLNSVKAEEFPWMSEVTKVAPQNAIKNVGVAFQHFFRRVKQGGLHHRPAGRAVYARSWLARRHSYAQGGGILKMPKCHDCGSLNPFYFRAGLLRR